MTRDRAFGRDFAFLDWMRNCKDLDSRDARTVLTDFDVVVHQYRDRSRPADKQVDNLMILETKSHAKGPAFAGVVRGDSSFAQHDTWLVFNEFMCRRRRGRLNKAIARVRVAGEYRTVWFWGVHILAMNGDRVENSTSLWWDGRGPAEAARISHETLVKLLRFELDPFNPKQKTDYRNHHYGERGLTPLFDDRIA